MRLYDLIQAHPTAPKIPEGVMLVDASSVGRWIDDLPIKLDHEWSREDYGCVAPPGQEMWIEAETSSPLRNFFSDEEVRRENVPDIIIDMSRAVYLRTEEVDEEDREELSGARWVVWASMFTWISLNPTHIQFSPRDLFIFVDEDGYYIGDASKAPLVPSQLSHLPTESYRPGDIKLMVGHMPFVLHALARMHTSKNIIRTPYNRGQHRRLNKARHKAGMGKLEKPEFYWIGVDNHTHPPHYVLDALGVRNGDRAAHRVRGHFAYYHPDRPHVSGKAGFIWRNEHKRGNSDKGNLDKGYQV